MTTRRCVRSQTTMSQTIRLWPPSYIPTLTTSRSYTRHQETSTATRSPIMRDLVETTIRARWIRGSDESTDLPICRS
jgi:hypothetical protein